ncbi:MAG: NDP-sugar synthase [Cyanobacteria bacterium REEB67]|nr:NDP-sugar synthase [Cyanobacteria bacterium REEB67]
MKAMVLAAGVGSRLDPLTADIPKPLVPVANVPVMQHLLQLLHRHDFRQVVANLHYLPEKLVDYFGDGSRFDIELEFRREEKLSGDAGGVRFCRDFLAGGTFIVLMGDLLTDIDLTYVLAQHRAKGALASIALKQVEDVSHFGVAMLDEKGLIKGFQEKPKKEEALSNLASTGIYILEPEVFNYIPAQGDYGFGRQLFPTLVAEGLPVLGVEVGSYWSDVGTIEQYWHSNFDVLEGKMKVDMPGYEHIQTNGHSLYLAEGTVLDPTVTIGGNLVVGKGARIGAGVRLSGNNVIGAGAIVEAGCQLEGVVLWSDVVVAQKSKLERSVVLSSGVVNVFDHPKSVKRELALAAR